MLGMMIWRMNIALLALLTLAIHGACLCANAVPGCAETVVGDGMAAACPEHGQLHDAHHSHDCCQVACDTNAEFIFDSHLPGVAEAAILPTASLYYAAPNVNGSARSALDHRAYRPPSSIPLFIFIRTLLI